MFEGLQSQGRPSVITLHTGGVSARRPQVLLPFAARHRSARLAWCTQRWRWKKISARMLCVVPYQDLDRRMRVWRRVGERFTDPARVAHGRYVGLLL